MKKTLLIIVSITIVFLLAGINVAAQGISVQTHDISIIEENDKITVHENLEIKGTIGSTYKTLSFWIPTGNSNLKISVNSQEINMITPQNQNIYVCNLSGLNISADTLIKVDINYDLKTDTAEFQKTLTYNTSKITVEFNNEQIYTAMNLQKDTTFTIKLTEKETKEIIEKPDYSTYYYIIGFLILIIIVLAYLQVKKPQKQIRAKKHIPQTASEELLTTRKALLLEILKEIEKKHRAKQISEDTYNKLKEHYKQEAVETMKQLEDMKSKIK